MTSTPSDLPGPLPCSFEGCDRPRYSSGLCKTHAAQKRAGKELTAIRPHVRRGQNTTCSFPGCDRKHSSKGLCQTHYQQQNDGKELTVIRGWVPQAAWGGECRYADCDAEPHSRGYCIVHYGRGIPQHARNAILAAQGGKCLCGRTDPGATGWHLDHAHDHICDHAAENYCAHCARGLLCMSCNRHGVAWYEDTYRPGGNPPIEVLEGWIHRRLEFTGDIDSPDITVVIRDARDMR